MSILFLHTFLPWQSHNLWYDSHRQPHIHISSPLLPFTFPRLLQLVSVHIPSVYLTGCSPQVPWKQATDTLSWMYQKRGKCHTDITPLPASRSDQGVLWLMCKTARGWKSLSKAVLQKDALRCVDNGSYDFDVTTDSTKLDRIHLGQLVLTIWK